MSRNGSGTYSLPSGNPVVTGTVISSTWANNTLNDIASALTTSIASDGQTTITANLPMSGYKLTGLGAGANPGDSVRYEQLFPSFSTDTVAIGAGGLTVSGKAVFAGGTTLGDGAGDALLINSTAASLGGNLNINSGLLYLDKTNARVGINLTNPSYELDMAGSLRVTTSGAETTDFVYFRDASNNVSARFALAVTGGANVAATALFLNKNSSTSRSINAAGTVNASGADYAEYHYKAEGCGTVAKGEIVGIDSDGKITKLWAAATRFAIKSTDPAYVGGDRWGTDPATVDTERPKVDRIAYSGQVPVNVTGAKPGDYIIAMQDGDGIIGVPVSNPSFEQYRLAVLRVQSIQPDGRAFGSVIVH